MFTAKVAGWFLSRAARDKKEKNLCALCASAVKSSSPMTPTDSDDPGKKNQLN